MNVTIAPCIGHADLSSSLDGLVDQARAAAHEYQRVGGVYFLFDGDELVYVGKSDHIIPRMSSYVAKSTVMKITRMAWARVDDPAVRAALEVELIARFKPKYNRIERHKAIYREALRRNQRASVSALHQES